MGYKTATPVQSQVIQPILAGRDILASAQTGTGKTAAFLLPIIHKLITEPHPEDHINALIIVPTRELAIQIAGNMEGLGYFTNVSSIAIYGGGDGNSFTTEKTALTSGVDIVVCTPGRMIAHLNMGYVNLKHCSYLVLDEADRMLDMGFIPQVRAIVARTPAKDCRQTLLFSATFTPEILELTRRWAMDPIMVEIEPEKVATDTIDQIVYLVTTEDKYKLLYNLIQAQGADKVIVFNNRRDQVRKLADNLYRHGINCGLLSGEVAQNKRVQTLEAFREGKLQVLVATDVAGRGLHIDDVTHVINFSLPEEAEDYVHRIGRTGRAGNVGTSISFACEEDSFLLPNIEEKLGRKLACIRPDDALLAPPPPFSRPTKFVAPPKTGERSGSGRSSDSRGRDGRSGGRAPRR